MVRDLSSVAKIRTNTRELDLLPWHNIKKQTYLLVFSVRAR